MENRVVEKNFLSDPVLLHTPNLCNLMNPTRLGVISKKVGQKEPKTSMHFSLIKTLSIVLTSLNTEAHTKE